MAAAVALHAPAIGPLGIPLSSSPELSTHATASLAPSISEKYTPVDAVASKVPGNQCEGCKTRNSRCAVNFVTKKCYSCDFHRQDCVFNPNTSRKRSCPQAADTIGKKSSHARDRSLTSSFKELLQSPMGGGSEGEVSNASDVSASAGGESSSYLYLRGATHLDPLLLEHVPFDEKSNETLLGSAIFRRIGRHPGEFAKAVGPQTTHNGRRAMTARLLEGLSSTDSDFLVQRFFEVVHPVFPVLQEESFRRCYDKRSVEPLLLAAVCLIARSCLAGSGDLLRETATLISEAAIYEQARLALERPNLNVLQAGLLLLQHPNQRYQHMSSQVVSGAFSLGLHQDCSQWMIRPEEQRARKRLAWALYAQDKWQALLHGRPAQITASNWLVKPLAEEDFENTLSSEAAVSPQGRHSATLFVEQIALSQLLAEILDTFYTLAAEREIRENAENGLGVALGRAKPVQIRLKDWFANLPPSLKMDAAGGDDAGAKGILHLAYFATEVALHRCIVGASAVPGTDSYLAHICRSAAKTRLISAMDFVNRLRPPHFKYAWPFASASNFGLVGTFGVLLQATAPTKEEADFYRARLNEYRWTLAVSRCDAGFLDSAIHLLDDSTALLLHVPEKPGIAEFVSTHPGSCGHGLPPPTPLCVRPSLSRPSFHGSFSPESSPVSSSDHDAGFRQHE